MRCGERFSSYEEVSRRALRAEQRPGRAGRRRGRSRRASAAQLDRVPRGVDRDGAAGRQRRADQLALARRGDRPRAERQRREGARRARRPVARDRPSVPDGLAIVLVPAGEGSSRSPRDLLDGALWWPEWLAGHEPWAQAPRGGADEHHLHLRDDRPTEGRRAHARHRGAARGDAGAARRDLPAGARASAR